MSKEWIVGTLTLGMPLSAVKPISPAYVAQRLHLEPGANILSDSQIHRLEEIFADHGFPVQFTPNGTGLKITFDVHTMTFAEPDEFDKWYKSDSELGVVQKTTAWSGQIIAYVMPSLIASMTYHSGDAIHIETPKLPWQPKVKNDPTVLEGNRVRATLQELVPDFQARVKYPCDCICSRSGGGSGCSYNLRFGRMVDIPLNDAIIALNDHCKWSRERIADWLDSLDLDLRFRKPEPRPVDFRPKSIDFDSVVETIAGASLTTLINLLDYSGWMMKGVSISAQECFQMSKVVGFLDYTNQYLPPIDEKLISDADPYLLKYIEDKKKASAAYAEILQELHKSKKKK